MARSHLDRDNPDVGRAVIEGSGLAMAAHSVQQALQLALPDRLAAP